MVSFQGQIEPEESVSGLTAIIDDNANASPGRFWHTNGEFYLGSVLIFRQCQKLIHLYIQVIIRAYLWYQYCNIKSTPYLEKRLFKYNHMISPF